MCAMQILILVLSLLLGFPGFTRECLTLILTRSSPSEELGSDPDDISNTQTAEDEQISNSKP